MKRKLRALPFFWIFPCLFLGACYVEGVRVQSGRIDLTAYDFEQGPHTLNGAWEVYWNEFLFEEDFATSRNADGDGRSTPDFYLSVPGDWAGIHVGDEVLGPHGFATLRFVMLLPPMRDRYALAIPETGQAYRLFVNGDLLIENGVPGTREHQEFPNWRPRVAILPAAADGRYEIVLHLSNFHNRLGGVWYPVQVGHESHILTRRYASIAYDALAFGAIAILGLYYLAFYSLRHRDRGAFFFAAFCLVFAIRTLHTGEKFLLHVWPDIPFSIFYRIELLTYIAAVPLFFHVVARVFPDEYRRSVLAAITWTATIFFAFVLFFPGSLSNHAIPLYHAVTVVGGVYAGYATLLAVRRRRDGATSFAAGYLALFLTGVNDIFHSQLVIQTFYMVPLGILAFVFSQAYVLARRFARALDVSEELSTRLEEQVIERTAQLDARRRDSEVLNQISREMNTTLDLEPVMDLVISHMERYYNVEGTMLQLVDPTTQELYYYRTNFGPQHEDELRAYVRGLRISFVEKESTAARILARRRPIYFPHFTRRAASGQDPMMMFVERARIRSALMVPLHVRDAPIGMMYFSNYSRPLRLNKEDIESIARFCEQVAAAVQAASLLKDVRTEREKSDQLLFNVLPRPIAEELKRNGFVQPVLYPSVTIMFTDFKGFTAWAARTLPEDLVAELDRIFERFDAIVERSGLEKLKTIGDAYMCVGGLPDETRSHAIDTCLAALELQLLMEDLRRERGDHFLGLRVGIHSGTVIAGVIGKRKFAYDVWGDAVNVAARMESLAESDRINISEETNALVSEYFETEYRGEFEAKNRGHLKMYNLLRLKPHWSRDDAGRLPDERFLEYRRSIGL